MSADPHRVKELFAAALDRPDAPARAALLDQECAGDPELRRRLAVLLAAHDAPESALERPLAVEPATGAFHPRAEAVGTVIAGKYKLLELIGEGGMGEVWVADQLEPIRRRVALKVIKAGMDSKSVLARFEAERQALALMDHPNIARVLDAGATADGRPFFVMELVKGTPITDFCDARKLSPRERLQLFIPVCQAIQHAHQKGIIHRDIKPSNVLVALHDEKPVPKVIDFGVAKAIGRQLTEKTLYTGFGALIGTPAYMAPEQATFNQLDVDTRADVYALGVLLYELLAGSPPFEPARLRLAALDEVLRLVREEEPQRPSARLSTSQARATIAAVRRSDPDRLARLIRGELDWIVMRALEKDRNRRYESATGLAKDVERYLKDEPVEACPPSIGYRLRRVLRRHRRPAAVAAAVAALLLAAGAFAYRAHRLEGQRLADQRRHDDQLLAERRQTALDKALLVSMSGDLEATDQAIAEAELLGVSAGQVRMLRGRVAIHRQEFPEAIGHLEKAVRLLPESVAARASLATAYVNNMERGTYLKTLREVKQLTPVAPEDFLFKAQAESFDDPEGGLKTLDEGLRQRDATTAHSTIAHSIRAGVYTRVAFQMSDLAAAAKAIEHATVVKTMMPGQQYPLTASVHAHLTAAQLLKEGGHEERRRAALAQAERDARALEGFPTHSVAVFWRYAYLVYVGQRDAGYEALRRISEQTTNQWVLLSFARELYRRGEYQRAAEFLDRRKEGPGRTHTFHVVRAYVLAELPDGSARALEAYKDAAALTGTSDWPAHMVLPVLGRKAEAVAVTRELRHQVELRRQAGLMLSAAPEWNQRLADYSSDLIPAEELLRAAGRSRLNRCMAHYQIGLRLLGEGDRPGARDQFRRCVATNAYLMFAYQWAEAFLARLEQDPAWPPWVPAKN